MIRQKVQKTKQLNPVHLVCFTLVLLLFPTLAEAAWQLSNTASIADSQDAKLRSPGGIALDESGNLYVAEREGHQVRKIDTENQMSVVAGNSAAGFQGDGKLAREAQLNGPESVAIDLEGNLLIADRGNHRIRKVNVETGIITTVAGNGKRGFSGDGGDARNAHLNSPYSVCVDSENNIFIADTDNHRIRKVDAKTGVIHTVAGNGNKGFSGDANAATDARLNRPHNVTIDSASDDLIIGDSFNQRIRLVSNQTGLISTLYGIGEVGLSDDQTLASEAKFGFFGAILVTDEYVIFSEWINHRIRLVCRESGRLDSLRDVDGNAIQISSPYGIAIREGTLYLVESDSSCIHQVDLQTGESKIIIGSKQKNPK